MALRSHTHCQDGGTMEPGGERCYFVIDTTTSGTIDTATSGLTRSKCAITVAKTASKTGRYTFTFDGYFVRLLAFCVGIEGAADAAYTAGKGSIFMARGRSPTTGVIYLQAKRPDTEADAEVEDAANIFGYFDIQLSRARDR